MNILKRATFNSTWLWWILALIVLSEFFFFNIVYLYNKWQVPYIGDDFNHYWISARLFLEGKNPYSVSFSELSLPCCFRVDPIIPGATNPPFLLLFTSFLGSFEPYTAYYLWEGMLLVFAVLAMGIIYKLVGSSWSMRAALLSFGMYIASLPLVSNFWYGQFQLVLLLIVVVGWWAYRSGNTYIAAALWGLTVSLKLFTWPLMFLFIAERQWRAVLVGITVTLVGFTLPVFVGGIDLYLAFYENGFPIIKSFVDTVGFNYSLNGLVLQLNEFFKIESGAASLILSVVRYLISPAILLIFTHKAFGRLHSRAAKDLFIALLIFLSVLLSPVAWPHYLIFLVIPFAVCWTYSNKDFSTAFIMFIVWLGSSSYLLILSLKIALHLGKIEGLLLMLYPFLMIGVLLFMICGIWQKELIKSTL